MYEGIIFGRLDVAEFCWYVFLIFFAGLIIYLRREDRREGYPLEADTSGRREPTGSFLFFADPKKFRLFDGRIIPKPSPTDRDVRPLALKRLAPWPGAPSDPTGDPLVDGVGPASYAVRSQTVEPMHDGTPRIRPLRAAPEFTIAKGDPNLIGAPVYGSDGKLAGVVADIWVDRAEFLVRYLEVALKSGQNEPPGRHILMPMFVATVDRAKRTVRTDSISAAQFARAPDVAHPDQITLYDEERASAYFGGGYLYSRPSRKEPLL